MDILAQRGVNGRLVLGMLAPEPFQNIGIQPQGYMSFDGTQDGERLAMPAGRCYCRSTGVHMSAVTFDTLGYFERLKAAGVPEEQAKVQANVMREVIEDKLATKADLLAVKTELQQQMKELEYRLTIRLGGMMAASIALVAALVKLT
jgi:hypothetical protein